MFKNRFALTRAQRAGFAAGVAAVLPTLIATSVWGFVTGVAMLKSGLSVPMASLMTLLVYAGSAQLTALPLIEAHAPLWLIFAAGFIVNIRFIIFGAALQPYLRHLPWKKRLMLGYISSDMVFVLFMSRFGKHVPRQSSTQVWFFIGVVVVGWLTWQGSSLAGVLLGGLIPDSWSLEYAAILALIAILAPLVATKPLWCCLLVASVVAVLSQGLPLRLGLLVAVVSGVLAGVLSEQYLARKGAAV